MRSINHKLSHNGNLLCRDNGLLLGQNNKPLTVVILHQHYEIVGQNNDLLSQNNEITSQNEKQC